MWLLVPVLGGEISHFSHTGGRGIHRRLKGILNSAARIHYGVTFDANNDVCVDAIVVVVPHSRGGGGVTRHGVTGVRTVFNRHVAERKLPVLVELFELGATVLEPDLDLEQRWGMLRKL